MSAKPISMLQLKRIIQLNAGGSKIKTIADQCKMARKTVRIYLARIGETKLASEELLKLSEEDLSLLVQDPLQSKNGNDERYLRFQNILEELLAELKKTGVTRKLLWQEYREKYPDGFGYTQFCEHLQRLQKQKNTVMHFLHEPGKQLMIDFAGNLFVSKSEEGEIKKYQVFVAVLPYSGYCFVQAVETQNQQDFIHCLESALKFFGGVPKIIIPDNLKSCVKKTDRYEPELNVLMDQFALHYNTAIMPARVAKPKDKASVESAVNLAYQRVYAPLRNRQFSSLEQINEAFLDQLDIHHHKKFRMSDKTRAELFAEIEQKTLTSLPCEIFYRIKTVHITVRPNYHVVLNEDKHNYSVPHTLCGKKVEVRYSEATVSIYFNNQCVAVHLRQRRGGYYTTNPQHMPSNHAHYAKAQGWTDDTFLSQAQNIHPDVYDLFSFILQKNIVKEQSYNSCMGILAMRKKYTSLRVIKACRMALDAKAYRYTFVRDTLKNNRDMITQKTLFFGESLPSHDNIRGKDAF